MNHERAYLLKKLDEQRTRFNQQAFTPANELGYQTGYNDALDKLEQTINQNIIYPNITYHGTTQI